MKITKILAAEITAAALLDKKNALYNAEAMFNAHCTAWAEDSIPQDVKDFYAKRPSYCVAKKYATFIVPDKKINFGVRHLMTKYLPVPDAQGYPFSGTFAISGEVGKLYEKELQALETQKEQFEKLHSELERAILSLSTKKRVLENLPELEKYFPAEETTRALVPDFTTLRAKLL